MSVCLILRDVGVLWLNSLTDRPGFWYEGYHKRELYCELDGVGVRNLHLSIRKARPPGSGVPWTFKKIPLAAVELRGVGRCELANSHRSLLIQALC